MARSEWGRAASRGVLALTALAVLGACGKKEKARKEGAGGPAVVPGDADPARYLAAGIYPSVGRIRKSGSNLCSGIILRHGVFATARHCFANVQPQAPFTNYSLSFTDATGIDGPKSIPVTGKDVKDIRLDKGQNDLAYVIYEPAATKGKVDLKDGKAIIRTVPEPGTPLNVVGLPGHTDKKLVTRPCHRQDRSGTIGPKPRDSGYVGTLYDTDCGAWFGNSGGPFFVMEDDNVTVKGVVGVVTHTFDTDDQGEILASALAEDAFGTYVKTVNFSPFQDALSLDEVLALGQD